MIRSIRFLGAALGVLVGLTLASVEGGLFTGMQYSGAVLAAWTIAWLVAGFGVLPYLTIVPAGWVLRQVQQLSTAEFVTAVLGLLIGLLMGLLGELRSVSGLERRLREAARLGFGWAIVPAGARGERPAAVPGLEIVPVATLRDAVEAALREAPEAVVR